MSLEIGNLMEDTQGPGLVVDEMLDQIIGRDNLDLVPALELPRFQSLADLRHLERDIARECLVEELRECLAIEPPRGEGFVVQPLEAT